MYRTRMFGQSGYGRKANDPAGHQRVVEGRGREKKK